MLCAHEARHQPLPTVRGQDADDSHPGTGKPRTRNRQFERIRPGAADDLVSVEGGEDAFWRHQRGHPLGVHARRLPPEVVADHSERGAVLVRVADGPDPVGHYESFSSGAYSSISFRSLPSPAKRTVMIPPGSILVTTPSPSEV